ncbi:cyclase family protein [Methanolobus profundi]|uniref:Kynurenine formamidase n=1 Tax=Methanolobus profundi TaxID=487685 RepID=A0A1I4UUZ4_9EURY|nr:cyclase family protein [Methanolobus profundi]SFM92705.1 Kynurenine formamidase [Methanolobus profundi]
MKGKIIDITTGISVDTPVYDGDPVPVVEKVSSIEEDGFAVSLISIGTHTGTHVDAPSHILKDGPSVDKIEPSSLMGEAIMLDLSSGEGPITSEELETNYLSFACGDDIPVLLIRTKRVSSSHIMTDQERFLTSSAGKWIMDHGFSVVGVDTLSVDSEPSLPNHSLFLKNEIHIVEYLHLSEVIEGLYYFICLPLKVIGCDGAPARVILIK